MHNQLLSAPDNSSGISFVAPEYASCSEEVLSPEKRLLLAILEQAIRDLLEETTPPAKQASRWFFEDWNEDCCLPFSFSWICRQLDLDLSVIQARVKRIQDFGVPAEMTWAFRR